MFEAYKYYCKCENTQLATSYEKSFEPVSCYVPTAVKIVCIECGLEKNN